MLQITDYSKTAFLVHRPYDLLMQGCSSTAGRGKNMMHPRFQIIIIKMKDQEMHLWSEESVTGWDDGEMNRFLETFLKPANGIKNTVLIALT